MPKKRKPGDPEGPKSGSDKTRLRASVRRPGNIGSRRHAAGTERVPSRGVSRVLRTKKLTAQEAKQKIDRQLGNWQHRMQLRDQAKGKASGAADKTWKASEAIKRGAKKAKK